MALRMILGRLVVGVRALQNPTIRASMASMASNAVIQNGGIPPLSDMIQAEFDFDKTSTIWKELLVLARQPGVCNLGQGCPDYNGHQVAREAAVQAMLDPDKSALNQYSMPAGLKSLQDAVCAYYNNVYGLREGQAKRAITPENVLITVGATEGLYNSMKALVGPGDEVILFNPGFPFYLAMIRLMGATPVFVELDGPDFAPDLEKFEKAITPKTRVLLLNSPHNPCGHCYTKEEIEGFARLALKYNLFVLSDEVYENTTFGDAKHLRLADEEGMFERTITLCSASKLFSLTGLRLRSRGSPSGGSLWIGLMGQGWRVGWALSTPELLKGLNVSHCMTSYCAPTPLQHGLAVALEAEDGTFEGIPKLVEGNAELLGSALREKGFGVTQPEGGHFLVADTSPLGLKGVECAKLMLANAKVSVVPGIIFYFADPNADETVDIDRPLLRFALCKRRDTIEEAVRRIRQMTFPPIPPPEIH